MSIAMEERYAHRFLESYINNPTFSDDYEVEAYCRRALDGIFDYVLKECPDLVRLNAFYQQVSPERVTNTEILAELCWIVYCSGFRVDIVRKYWDRIKQSFSNFDVNEVAILASDLEGNSIRISQECGIRNIRKASWCIQNAKRIMELNNEKKDIGGLRGYFVTLSEIDPMELIGISPKIVRELNLRGIGPVTICHLLKNMGIDIFKPDLHVCRLLGKLGLINSENTSIYEIGKAMLYLGGVYGLKISEIDTVLFEYGRSTGDLVENLAVR